MSVAAGSSAWLVRLAPPRNTKLSLVCVPHAGGSAWWYRHWTAQLPRWVELLGVEPPGRGHRVSERPYDNGVDLLGALVPALEACFKDRPLVLFGHSMGALIAFACAQSLSSEVARNLRAVIVSGQRAPHLPRRKSRIGDLPRDQFLAELRELDGIPSQVFELPELIDLLLPAMRADVRLVESWQPVSAEPLDVPLYALGGSDDPDVLPSELEAWAEHTAGEFRSALFEGGHFFLENTEEEVLENIRGILAGVSNTHKHLGLVGE